MLGNRDRSILNEGEHYTLSVVSAVVAGVGLFAVSMFVGDYSIVDNTVVGEAFDLMSGNLGTP